jgi:hypothetical protein
VRRARLTTLAFGSLRAPRRLLTTLAFGSLRAPRRLLTTLALVLLAAASARAQNVTVETSERPYYVGTPVQIVLLLDGFEPEPEPEVVVADPANGTLSFGGLSASRSTQVTVVNGELTRTDRVQYEASFRYFAATPGTVRLGPFKVVQGSTERTVSAFDVVINGVPTSDRLRIRLDLPETTYVGARVPVKLEYWFDRDLVPAIVSSSLQLPLATLLDGFRLVTPESRGAQTLEIETGGDPLRLPTRQRSEREGEREFAVVSAPFELIPRRPGSYTLGAATATLEEGVSWRRDFLGGRAPTRVQRIGAVDRPRTLVVKAVPALGQPASFAGAVGSGFGLEVTADRSVVQVGDPITLTFDLSGDGALDTAGLPPLGAKGLLPATDFSVATQEPSGVVDGTRKRFTAVVRVLREGVTEVPALEYSFFDPRRERYETVSTRPIALSVGAARIVGSSDVVSAVPSAEQPALARPSAASAGLSLTGADLAIERNTAVLRATPGRLLGSIGIAAVLYVISLGAVVAAVLDRRRRAVDPVVRERRARVARELARAERASEQPGRGGVESLAGALRALRAELPAARAGDLENFLARCDALVFAPASADPAPGSAVPALASETWAVLHREGVALARALAEHAP